MKFDWLKRPLPRGLYGRAALILILPVLTLQVAAALVFIQRHFEDVTGQLTTGVVLETRLLHGLVEGAPDPAMARARLAPVASVLRVATLLPDPAAPATDSRRFYDLSGRSVIATLRGAALPVRAVDLAGDTRALVLWLDTGQGVLRLRFDRRRASASNPHQFLVLTAGFALVMTGVAFVYLRNQLRPITRLAAAAEAFGKGRRIPYRPSGALEVRAAGAAFLAMRARIERQIETRTMMLSGVSHDLRTPLTRLRLALSMLPETEETADMARDLDEMERLITAFLDFARADALDDPQMVAPADLLRRVVADHQRGGGALRLIAPPEAAEAPAPLRAVAVERALGNLIGNALRYAGRAEVSLLAEPNAWRFRIEDDGPGIPPDRREEALRPFARLDRARNQNRGSGVGLGLAIAADIARSHGGRLELGSSPLGGLRADLVLAR